MQADGERKKNDPAYPENIAFVDGGLQKGSAQKREKG
jgi:hypothetical protein